jgi:iron complex transport system ATP-binding protein
MPAAGAKCVYLLCYLACNILGVEIDDYCIAYETKCFGGPSPMIHKKKLVAKDLCLSIDKFSILSDVNLSLDAGKVMGILGPNGAGKTSLLKMLSGQRDSHGQVSWHDQSLSDYTTVGLAQQIAVVNQLNDTVFALNLQQIVRMGLLPHKSLLSKHTSEDEQQIADAIARVVLTDKSLQSFHSMSCGEQQRGLIARALVQKAALIILDEPVNHLDVYYQHQVLGLLRSLAHKLNITVVMSLHDLNLAANYCDHLCLLDKGRIVAQGDASQVLTATRLQQVFALPCHIRREPITAAFRVDFYSPEEIETTPKLAPQQSQHA